MKTRRKELHSSKTKQNYLSKFCSRLYAFIIGDLWNFIIKSWGKMKYSLFFQSIRIVFVLTPFLLLLFSVLPNSVYIDSSIEADQFTIHNSEIEECTLLAKQLVFSDADTISISFHPYSTTRTNMNTTDEGTIQLVPVSVVSDIVTIKTKDDSIVLNEEGLNEMGWGSSYYGLFVEIRPDLVHSQTPPEVEIYSVSRFSVSRDEHYFSVNDDYLRCNNFKSQNTRKDQISCGSISFNKSDGIINKNISEFDIKGDGNFDEEKYLMVQISSCSVRLSLGLDFEDSNMFKQYSSNETVCIFFPHNRSINLSTSGTNCIFSNVKNLQCKISQIQSLNLFGDGYIILTYTPDSKDYTILQQPIILESKDENYLSVNIFETNNNTQDDKQISYSISILGFAKEILLGNISLIPSIFTWIRENVYVLPTSLVAIIIGSISLVNGSKEKKKYEC